MQMLKLYLAGKITGDQNYKTKFGSVAGELRKQGYSVMNPAMLPDGFDYDDYMHVCKAMIERCDAVVLLPDWKDSNGAKMEFGHAAANGIRCVTLQTIMRCELNTPETTDEE